MGYELINGIYKKGRRGDRKTEGAQAVRDVASSHTLVVSCEDYLCIAEMRNGVSRQTPRRLHASRGKTCEDVRQHSFIGELTFLLQRNA